MSERDDINLVMPDPDDAEAGRDSTGRTRNLPRNEPDLS